MSPEIIAEFINRNGDSEKEKMDLWVAYSLMSLNQSEGVTWEEDKEIEFGFDRAIGSLIIKWRGPKRD